MFSPERIFMFSVFFVSLIYFNADFSSAAMQKEEEAPFISKIIINGDSVIYSYYVSLKTGSAAGENIKLDRRNNNIGFELSHQESFKYRYFLEGFDRDVTPWQKRWYREYTNLPSGSYIFHVYYTGEDNIERQISPVTFRVLTLWYFSPVALAVYFLLFTAVIWFLYEQLNYRFARKQYMLEQIINSRTEALIIEKEKTEALLANVLPKNMANEIIAKGKAAKVKYNFVTVLFSDIQGFTKIAEEMNPEVLIDELDKFFFHFDSVVGKYGIEKIKTIGDAYMCAGGIPEKNRTNPVEVVLAALEMQKYMHTLKETAGIAGLKYWDIRIGIHTGTVVAGIIGHTKLSYDIWGDTVNTASRMESAGEAGKINISGTTYEFVKEFFICEHRGKMPVKYKGELDMYFVKSIVPELCEEDGSPARSFFIKLQTLKLLDVDEIVFKIFDDEASPDLYFHNSGLVRNICSQVELLATGEGLPEEDYINLRLAALFLFTGYVTDYEKPMEASCRFVEEILPKYGFGQENIAETLRLIAAAFANKPENKSDLILHDARYAYLGRVDYKILSDKLFRELSEHGKITDPGSWRETQLKLILEHDFKTNTARLLRSVSIEDQINNFDGNIS
jgi:class 3 adenylate cyclase